MPKALQNKKKEEKRINQEVEKQVTMAVGEIFLENAFFMLAARQDYLEHKGYTDKIQVTPSF